MGVCLLLHVCGCKGASGRCKGRFKASLGVCLLAVTGYGAARGPAPQDTAPPARRASMPCQRAPNSCAQERLTLKHKNTSRWARRALKRGQVSMDDGTRAAVAEQLRLGEELRQRVRRPCAACSHAEGLAVWPEDRAGRPACTAGPQSRHDERGWPGSSSSAASSALHHPPAGEPHEGSRGRRQRRLHLGIG
jgi:hypothetical protein